MAEPPVEFLLTPAAISASFNAKARVQWAGFNSCFSQVPTVSSGVDRNEVSIAFEIVLEELEGVVENLNQDGAAAFQRGDYEAAKEMVESATRLSDFRSKVRGLQGGMGPAISTKCAGSPADPDTAVPAAKRFANTGGLIPSTYS